MRELMNISLNTITIHQDPLGLRDLPLLETEKDGWSEIKSALEEQNALSQKHSTNFRWLALAASLVLAVFVTTRQNTEIQIPSDLPATQSTELASDESVTNINSLISLSQTLESQLRTLRGSTGSMPANSAIYIAELEDFVAQVDSELSESPDSLNLWGQRVNLLLDLAQIYQHHWETEYGQMASL
jgi:hypothetical protein